MAKILIIGGGVAGLTAGIYARKYGHRAIICEKHSIVGGNLTGWQRGDYHIDNCIHWLTGTNPNTALYKTWEDLGALGGVPIRQGETLYTCEVDGKRLSLHKNLEKMERDMLATSPADKREILALINAVRTVQGLFGVAGENHDQTSSFVQRTRTCPALLRYARLSTGELAAKFSHPLLKGFISCLIGEDFSAIALLVIFATFCGENGGLPAGGSLAMAKRISERFTSLGGELFLHKEAVKIHVHGKKATSVSFSDGTNIRADYVIFTADPKCLFDTLLQREMPRAWQKQYQKKTRFSAYHCAFACDREKLPFSGDFIFEIPQSEQEKLGTKHLIVREFSHEPDFAPKGKNILQTLTFCNERDSREFIELRNADKAAYKKKKQEIANTVQALIVKKFPELKGKLECIDVWTPASYRRYLGAEIGSFMGFLLPKDSLPRRMSAHIDGLQNVLLASQWQQAPGGLPIAANLGKKSIERVEALETKFLKAEARRLALPRAKRKRKA